MMKRLSSLFFLSFLMGVKAFGASPVNVYSYASSNVTTSAYSQIWAATPTSSAYLEICDSSGHMLKLASGAAGSQVDVAVVPVSGCVVVPMFIVAGTTLWLKAIDANATTGYNAITLSGG